MSVSLKTARLVPGDAVDVAIFRAGPPTRRPIGYLPGVVMHAGIEVDVRLLLSDEDEERGLDAEDVEETLAVDGDVRLEDLLEGPHYVLRNCQPEQVSLVPVPALPRDVFEALRLRIHDSHLVEALALRLGVES